jgi:hypothetical protein
VGTEFWKSLFALPETPHYFAIFAWSATFGGFGLVVVYLLMSIGALRGLRSVSNFVGVVIAAILGIAISGGAIYGAFADVTQPTLLAPIYALAWFAIGFILTLVARGRTPASQVLPDLRAREAPSSM